MSVSIATEIGQVSRIARSCLKLDRKGFQTGISYFLDRAMAVVERVTLATFVTGTITMLVIGALLNIVGLGIFCWACARSQPMHYRSSSL